MKRNQLLKRMILFLLLFTFVINCFIPASVHADE